MTLNEISRVQEYLRSVFGNSRIRVIQPTRPNAPVEVSLDNEFLGVLYRDEDEGDVSYAFNMAILEEDLPPAASI